jgi:predicted choloylglycine hydrolase
MLHNASTVEEALKYIEPYFIPFIKSAQVVIADQNGDYAVLNVNGIARRH